MRQPALVEVLSAVADVFTESTTYSRNSHAMRHQECFALKPNTDGMMDVLRKAFLANVDDIYRLADEYAETHDMTVAVKETTGRGYFLSVPAEEVDLPAVFIQPVKSGRYIHCTTEEVRGSELLQIHFKFLWDALVIAYIVLCRVLFRVLLVSFFIQKYPSGAWRINKSCLVIAQIIYAH